MHEQPRVVAAEDQVRRPAHPWTATVHELLGHLTAHAVHGVPQPLALDGEIETVTLVPGVAGRACWPLQATDSGLVSAAVLLRRIHDATRGWTPPPRARWALPAVPGEDVVICHGDPGPWNMTWVDGEAVGLFDWDFAHPAPPMDDIAYALEYLAPFRSDEVAMRWHGFAEPPDRRRRIALFAEAYGWACADGLVDAVIARQEATTGHVRLLAAQGVQPQAGWVADGFLDELVQRVRWSQEHRHLME